MIIEKLRALQKDGTFDLLRQAGKEKLVEQLERTLMVWNVYDSYMKCGLNKTNAVYLTSRKLGHADSFVWDTIKQVSQPTELFNDENITIDPDSSTS